MASSVRVVGGNRSPVTGGAKAFSTKSFWRGSTADRSVDSCRELWMYAVDVWSRRSIVHIDLVHPGLYDAEVALTTTSFAVLGLLSIAPMSGYDLHQAVDRSVRHIWPISKSQVYAELARLVPLGLIAGTDVAQARLPDER